MVRQDHHARHPVRDCWQTRHVPDPRIQVKTEIIKLQAWSIAEHKGIAEATAFILNADR